MKGDGVLRKLSEAQLNALINEFDELKVRVSTSKLLENWLLKKWGQGSDQEGHPSKVAPNTTIVQEGSLNYTDRNKLRVHLRKNTLRFFLEIGFVKLLKLSKNELGSLNQVSFDQVSAKWYYLSAISSIVQVQINFFAIRTRSSLNKRLFIIKSGIVSVLNETQNMYGGLSVNPALQGMKKITKAEVQFTDLRLTRSLKHFLLYFFTFFT